MGTLGQDLRYGARMLRKNLGFTAVVVVTIALGIGANSAIFSVVNAVLLRPLPYKDPDRLMLIMAANFSRGVTRMGLAPPDYREWRDQSQSFAQMAAYYGGNFNLASSAEPERVQGLLVTASLFPLLGSQAMLGRTPLPDEEQFGRHRVVVLSHGLWQRRFGSDRDLVGQAITLNGESFTVVGIMPREFQYPGPGVELWVPMAFESGSNWNTRNNYFLTALGRLKPGVTPEQARADMDTICRRLEQAYKESAGVRASITPLREAIVGRIQTALLVLLGAVGFVLLIACANVANLLLVRSAARRKEIAIRTALGATRPRMIRQLLAESVLLAALGGALGLLLTLWGLDPLVALAASSLPRAREIHIDGRVLAFTLGLSLLTGMAFGLAPALQVSKVGLSDALKEGGRSATDGLRSRRVRSLFAVVQVALSLILLTGAGLMIKSFYYLHGINPGFKPDDVLTMLIPLPPSKYGKAPQSAAFFQQVLERVASLPGVRAVGTTSSLPLSRQGGWGKYFTVEGRPPAATLAEVPNVQYRLVSGRYFQTMGIPLRKGRLLADTDGQGSPAVALINEALARYHFPDEDPLGKHIRLDAPEHLVPRNLRRPEFTSPLLTIVGVVGDVRQVGLDQPPGPEVYVPDLQNRDAPVPMFLVVRTTADPLGLVPAVRRQVWAVDKDQPVANIATMEQRLSDSLAQPRFNMLLLGLFAALALILAAVGLYGVMAYAVVQRTHEMGIRMALGAQQGDILRLVIEQGMVVAVIGVALGLVGALALSRVLSNLLYEVRTTDPATFAGVSLLLTLVALLASYLPARRATKVDPMVALRYE